ncbi:hypothetical protein [Aquimarina sp. MMG016]|uniref:hypothetical protein n=1 Tax=Aquimarina sp. MMG016 TaxID=2822690 RepID=UPI001B39E50B|nr:hypothetical protein [Aquimarina sp. MMG016]MBQ4821826.1 hypothetical protein [Aquimarina sp. MMG016]
MNILLLIMSICGLGSVIYQLFVYYKKDKELFKVYSYVLVFMCYFIYDVIIKRFLD